MVTIISVQWPNVFWSSSLILPFSLSLSHFYVNNLLRPGEAPNFSFGPIRPVRLTNDRLVEQQKVDDQMWGNQYWYVALPLLLVKFFGQFNERFAKARKKQLYFTGVKVKHFFSIILNVD